MEHGNDRPDERPLPCANGCGFFGSADTRGLCSKCYRDSVGRAVMFQTPTAGPGLAVPASSAAASAEHGAVAAAAATEEPGDTEAAAEAPQVKTKKRCAACGRSVGPMGFECRCGGVFCGAHRYSDRHDCDYDYRGAGRDAIARANPIIRADKVNKL